MEDIIYQGGPILSEGFDYLPGLKQIKIQYDC
jgi:hypothetical protein